jgi:hypothetical protein
MDPKTQRGNFLENSSNSFDQIIGSCVENTFIGLARFHCGASSYASLSDSNSCFQGNIVEVSCMRKYVPIFIDLMDCWSDVFFLN